MPELRQVTFFSIRYQRQIFISRKDINISRGTILQFHVKVSLGKFDEDKTLGE